MQNNQTPERKAKLKYRSAKRKQIQLDYSIEDFNEIKSYCESINQPVASWCKSVIANAIAQKES